MPRQSPDVNGETLDRICGQLEIYQARRGYRFGVESLLLAGFVQPGAGQAVDLGTGSGVLPMVLVHFGKVARATGVEIQPGLADRARRSVEHNRLQDRVAIVEADLKDLSNSLPAGRFDLVVANPPYGRPGEGVVSTDDEKARGKHEILCSLSDVVRAAARLLVFRGRFCCVLPPSRLLELLQLCQEHGLQPARLRLAHGRLDLPARHCLVEAVRAGKNELTVEPPLILYDESGEYTAEVQGMLYPSKAVPGS